MDKVEKMEIKIRRWLEDIFLMEDELIQLKAQNQIIDYKLRELSKDADEIMDVCSKVYKNDFR